MSCRLLHRWIFPLAGRQTNSRVPVIDRVTNTLLCLSHFLSFSDVLVQPLTVLTKHKTQQNLKLILQHWKHRYVTVASFLNTVADLSEFNSATIKYWPIYSKPNMHRQLWKGWQDGSEVISVYINKHTQTRSILTAMMFIGHWLLFSDDVWVSGG